MVRLFTLEGWNVVTPYFDAKKWSTGLNIRTPWMGDVEDTNIVCQMVAINRIVRICHYRRFVSSLSMQVSNSWEYFWNVNGFRK